MSENDLQNFGNIEKQKQKKKKTGFIDRKLTKSMQNMMNDPDNPFGSFLKEITDSDFSFKDMIEGFTGLQDDITNMYEILVYIDKKLDLLLKNKGIKLDKTE